ncbi:MAG: trypsin-like peptidase domain-containing protein [Thermoguttaceae bacterium]|jgi:S1-C subfamily serine protease
MIYPAKNFLLTFIALLGITSWGIAQELSGVDAAAAIEKNLVDVIANAEKSVVAIARVRRETSGETFRMELRPDPFDRRPILSAVPLPTDPDFIPNEYGTGVVVDRRGLILTAYHVLGEDSDYYVTTSDRKVYKALPKAADPRSDLAVLSIEAADLVPITLGNAAELKKGQIVVSLGNPYAIARDGQASAAWGIVSNLARKAPAGPGQSDPAGKTTLQHFGTLIQTDAKLNLGTSGGPLINLQGEMVGLSVALAAAAGYENAAGYAIPVDQTFRRVVETLKQGREVEYGFLGVQPTNLAAGEVLKGMHGIRVAQTIPGTPAVKYGLKTDDIITAVDDTPIQDADSFVLNVGKLPVEAIAHLDVIRDGRPRSVEVKLTKFAVRGKKIVTSSDPLWRGLRVEYPSAMMSAEVKATGPSPFASEGVIVAEVAENSPALKAGLQPGIIITHVGRTAVNTPKEFRAAVENISGPVVLRIADDKKNPTRTVEPGT